LFDSVVPRPKLTTTALRRWLPTVVRRLPDLFSAYFVPGRVSPRMREATMLGVTSVNRCAACDRVHQRWARATGLRIDDPRDLAPDEAAAHAYGQGLAVSGPRGVEPPTALSARHRRELEAVGVAMELANLAGNRFLPAREPTAATPDPSAAASAVAGRQADGLAVGVNAADYRGASLRVERTASADTTDPTIAGPWPSYSAEPGSPSEAALGELARWASTRERLSTVDAQR
jgi:AhpD family alkylhydroperoxidase